jgi:hypothetical protein
VKNGALLGDAVEAEVGDGVEVADGVEVELGDDVELDDGVGVGVGVVVGLDVGVPAAKMSKLKVVELVRVPDKTAFILRV